MTAEEIVRQFKRTCKGPPLWSPQAQDEIRQHLLLLDREGPCPEAMAAAKTKIAELLEEVQQRWGKRIVLMYPNNRTYAEVYANLLQLMRLHAVDVGNYCEYDVNELILADGIFDGSERTVTCPRCGTTITYLLKL